MNNITYAVSVDVNNPIIPYNVYVASVLDSNVRYLEITLYQNGNVIELSNTATATASLVTDNVLVNGSVNCTISHNIITVPLEDLQRHGNLDVQVTVTEGTKVLAIPFPIQVRVTPNIAEDAQVDEDSLGSYAEVVHEIAEARGTYTTLHDAIATKLDDADGSVKENNIADESITVEKVADDLAAVINAKMDADDATVYHVDTTTQTLTYDNTNPKTIYLNARVSYESVSNRAAVVISTSSKGYQFAITVTGDILMRGGGGTYPTDWTVLYGGSYKKNSIDDDNKNSSVFIPTIGAVVSYLVANYIGNGSGTVTETNLATVLKNSLYRVDNTTETVAYSADNPRTIYTNARVNGNKPTLVFTLGDNSQLAMYKDGNLYRRTYSNGAYGSWIDLKATSIGESNKTSGAYPTVQAVYNFVTAFVASSISGKANTTDVNTALYGKENLSNKVPNRAAMDNLNSETQYPSIKTMVQYTDDKALDVLGEVSDVKAYIGYTDDDILGLCADFENKRFTRLAGAADLSAGSDFDGLPMFGGRRRCAVSADGAINAYYDPDDHTAFDARVAAGDDVMVYQPKFYYKVVPLKLEKQANGTGFHLRKANYYVTAAPHAGFKLHPLFLDANGREVDYVLLSAYEASYFYTDGSNNSVCFRDGVDTASAIDADAVLKSVPNVKPISGRYKAMTKANLEMLAQRKSLGWHLDTIKSVSANQLLMAVELGTFNSQSAVGLGVVNTPNADQHNVASLTGSTAALGNVTGMAAETVYDVAGTETPYSTDGKLAVSYRGVENPWGNIFKHTNGINLCGDGGENGGRVYIADDFRFNESVRGEMTISGTDYHYPFAGFTAARDGGWVSAFGYGDERYDWLFIPSAVNENDANNAVPVGDYYTTRSLALNTFRATRFGGANNAGTNGGEFCWYCDINVGNRTRDIGGRLMYVPTAAE